MVQKNPFPLFFFLTLILILTLTLTPALTLTLAPTLTLYFNNIRGVYYMVSHLLPPGGDVVFK